MAKPYYVLVVRENGQWGVEFGDYDRGCVNEEAFEQTQCGVKRKDIKVLTTGESQADIDKAIAELNGGFNG